MAEPARTWQIRDARANFSTLVDKAISDGPQIVTRNGKKIVVVVSAERNGSAANAAMATSYNSLPTFPCATRIWTANAGRTTRAG
jgi:prevent-host-death family protein